MIYDVTVLENWEDTTELGLQEGPADLSDLPENLGPTHLFIDDCPDDTIHCNTPGYAPTEVGSYDSQPFCYNYLLCIPCEPYGHTQPDRCATINYWTDKCTADFCNNAQTPAMLNGRVVASSDVDADPCSGLQPGRYRPSGSRRRVVRET